MSKKSRAQEIKEEMKAKEIQLSQLEKHVDKSNICSDLYNKVVLEKAILKKELDDLDKNPLVEGVKNLIPRKKTLICDYFKGK